jgi:hypothetical protein
MELPNYFINLHATAPGIRMKTPVDAVCNRTGHPYEITQLIF